MILLSKCNHCDYINYLGKDCGRCPKCGAKMAELENPFKDEFFVTKVQNMKRQQVDVTVTFNIMSETLYNMVVPDKDKIAEDEDTQNRILFFMQIYLWTLLKKAPNLWGHIDTVVAGLKELMTLKVRGS